MRTIQNLVDTYWVSDDRQVKVDFDPKHIDVFIFGNGTMEFRTEQVKNGEDSLLLITKNYMRETTTFGVKFIDDSKIIFAFDGQEKVLQGHKKQVAVV